MSNRELFFSVSGPDTALAISIWERFPADQIYLYKKSQNTGEWMWTDIEPALAKARGLVIFWSKDYLQNEGTRRELLLASTLFGEYSSLSHAILLRLDDTPIREPDHCADADKPIYKALKQFQSVWYPQIDKDPEYITSLVDKTLLRVGAADGSPPLLRRADLLQSIKSSSRRADRRVKPVVWMRGLNGNGRRTLARESHREFSSDDQLIEIVFSEINLVSQICLRIASEVLKFEFAKLEALKNDPVYSTVAGFIRLIGDCCLRKKVVMLLQTSLPTANAQVVPDWLVSAIEQLTSSTKPKLYIVSPVHIPNDVLTQAGENIALSYVPWLSDGEGAAFAESLINHFDANRAERWSDKSRAAIVNICGGNPKLLVDIIRTASALNELESLDWVNRDVDRFSERLDGFLNWALNSLKSNPNAFETLRLIAEISPLPLQTASEILERPTNVDMNFLLGLGLIERLAEDVFQVAPLLKRRFITWPKADMSFVDTTATSLKKFAAKPRRIDPADERGEHTFLEIEAVANAGIRISGKAPDAIAKFVSAAQYFEIGLMLYNQRLRRDAYPLLRRAFEQRSEFGVTTKVEIARYFGLTAVRLHEESDLQLAIDFLSASAPGKGIASYLKGFQCQLGLQYTDAVQHFAEAHEAAKKENNTQRQMHTSRALVNAIRKSHKPNYRYAVQLARDAARKADTWFAQQSLAEACLDQLHKDQNTLTCGDEDELLNTYERALDKLVNNPAAGSAATIVEAYEYELTQDYESAELLLSSLKSPVRVEDTFRLWRVSLQLQDPLKWTGVAQQAKALLDRPSGGAREELLAPTLSYAIKALKKLDKARDARQLLDQMKYKLTTTQLSSLTRLLTKDDSVEIFYLDIAA
jgi:hypothetical protein